MTVSAVGISGFSPAAEKTQQTFYSALLRTVAYLSHVWHTIMI